MAEREQEDLNLFQENIETKTVEKEAINAEDANKGTDASTMSIMFDIDEDIANIQAKAIMAAAKRIDNGEKVGTGEVKQNNLEIEAALNTLETCGEDSTASAVSDHASRSECQLTALFAEKIADDARLVIHMGKELMETISSTIEVLQSHIRAFLEKAVEASERRSEHGYRMADFYHTMASKYESTVAALEERGRNIEIALNRAEESADECRKYAALAEEITDETLDESRRTKFSVCWWANKGRAANIVALKKERASLLMMKRMWISVQNDMEYEAKNRTIEDSDEETQQCQNRDRKTKIGHIITTFLGLALLSITSLFQVGSDSFNAILALGLLTTGWCAVYWSHKLYKCLKEEEENEEIVIETAQQDGFLENCDRNLELVKFHLQRYNVIMDSDTESDTGSSETIRVDEICQ